MDDVKQFFKTYYAPNNAVLALVGDLDTKETLAKVKKYFGNIPRQTPPTPVDLTEPRQGRRAPRARLQDPLARLTRIDIAYRIPPSSDAGCARARRGRVRFWAAAAAVSADAAAVAAAETIRASTSSWCRRKSSVTNVSCSTDRRVGPGMFHISATLRPGKTHAGSGRADRRRDRASLHAEPVTDKELARVRINVRARRGIASHRAEPRAGAGGCRGRV